MEYEVNLHDYPVYTKPTDSAGHKVPEALIGGNHKSTEESRYKSKSAKTPLNRYDLAIALCEPRS